MSVLKKRLMRAGSLRVVRRLIKPVPYLSTVVTIGLVGYTIRQKGLVWGLVDSGLDAMPYVGTTKGVIELFTGDLIQSSRMPRWRTAWSP